jgi:hypothetical protein
MAPHAGSDLIAVTNKVIANLDDTEPHRVELPYETLLNRCCCRAVGAQASGGGSGRSATWRERSHSDTSSPGNPRYSPIARPVPMITRTAKESVALPKSVYLG